MKRNEEVIFENPEVKYSDRMNSEGRYDRVAPIYDGWFPCDADQAFVNRIASGKILYGAKL